MSKDIGGRGVNPPKLRLSSPHKGSVSLKSEELYVSKGFLNKAGDGGTAGTKSEVERVEKLYAPTKKLYFFKALL